MVTISAGDKATNIEFVLRPNRSLNWKAACAAFAVFVAITAAIAAYFTSQGAWLVLPFAGLELLVLGTGFYLCALRTHTREVVRISADTIQVQRGRQRPTTELRIPRAWARVVLSQDVTHWYPSRLLIRSHGQNTEVGSQLVETERQQLAELLAQVLHQGAASPNSPSNHRPLPAAVQGHLPTETAPG